MFLCSTRAVLLSFPSWCFLPCWALCLLLHFSFLTSLLLFILFFKCVYSMFAALPCQCLIFISNIQASLSRFFIYSDEMREMSLWNPFYLGLICLSFANLLLLCVYFPVAWDFWGIEGECGWGWVCLKTLVVLLRHDYISVSRSVTPVGKGA